MDNIFKTNKKEGKNKNEIKKNKYLNSLKDGNGHLNPNQNKFKENHPDYSGYLKLDGKVLNISAWVKDKDGKKFLSVSVGVYNNDKKIPINQI